MTTAQRQRRCWAQCLAQRHVYRRRAGFGGVRPGRRIVPITTLMLSPSAAALIARARHDGVRADGWFEALSRRHSVQTRGLAVASSSRRVPA